MQPRSAIDYGLFNAQAIDLGVWSQRRGTTPFSDHYPVYFDVQVASVPTVDATVEGNQTLRRLTATRWWTRADAVALDNRWKALAEQFESEDISVADMYRNLTDLTYEVCKEDEQTRTCVEQAPKNGTHL